MSVFSLYVVTKREENASESRPNRFVDRIHTPGGYHSEKVCGNWATKGEETN